MMTIHQIKFSVGLFVMSSSLASAQATADFNVEGDFDTQFSGGVYTESASGGLNDSRCLTLASIAPTSFDGPLSEFHATGEFKQGAKFTVGAYFKMGSLGTGTARNGHILRLGITNGGTNTFSNTPFSTISISNSTTGLARFFARDTYGNHNTAFTLVADQWYYFETAFTRGVNTMTSGGIPTGLVNITYDMFVAEASSDGTLGSVLSRFSHTMDSISFVTQLNGKIYGAFRGESAYVNGANGVLDHFFVEKTPAPPSIISYTRDSITGSSTLVFASQNSAVYSLWGSDNLSNWIELEGLIAGTGGNITLTHMAQVPSSKFFYQIRGN